MSKNSASIVAAADNAFVVVAAANEKQMFSNFLRISEEIDAAHRFHGCALWILMIILIYLLLLLSHSLCARMILVLIVVGLDHVVLLLLHLLVLMLEEWKQTFKLSITQMYQLKVIRIYLSHLWILMMRLTAKLHLLSSILLHLHLLGVGWLM